METFEDFAQFVLRYPDARIGDSEDGFASGGLERDRDPSTLRVFESVAELRGRGEMVSVQRRGRAHGYVNQYLTMFIITFSHSSGAR